MLLKMTKKVEDKKSTKGSAKVMQTVSMYIFFFLADVSNLASLSKNIQLIEKPRSFL